MITTQELAKLAGVSQSTVSRSLSNSSRISVETRVRVQELAKEYGYNMKKKKSRTTHSIINNGGIVVIIGADKLKCPLELYLEYLLNEMVMQIEMQNYYPVVLPYDASEESFKYIQSVIETDDIKGVVIIYHEFQSTLEEYLSSFDMPHVYTQYFARDKKKTLNIIDVDHFTGGVIAANHLLSLGHQRIGTFTHYGSDFDERTAGFIAALKNNGIDHDPEWIIKSGNSYATAYEAIDKNWKKIEDCTAFFAQTDLVGIAAINYLVDRGYQVPQQYSVIGFDGLHEGTFCRPQLTTVIQPVNIIAESSMNRLVYLINQDDTSASHFFIQPQLCVRTSTGEARTSTGEARK